MSTLNVSNITDGTTTVGTSYVVNGSAKAWVYAQSDTTIRGSFNIASATDHGTGDFSYSLSNSFVTANDYSQSGLGRGTAASRTMTRNSDREAAGILAIELTVASSGAAVDNWVNVTAHGDLA